MADDKPDPRTTSIAYQHMQNFWAKVNAVLDGVDGLRAIAHEFSVPGPHQPVPNLNLLNRGMLGPQSPYLPKFTNETGTDYEIRRRSAPLTNIYQDISSNLSSKPFSKLLELADEAPDDLKTLSQNIDGQGNNLHVFSRDTFKAGLDKAIDWILVDYTKVPPGTTLADERSMGARPYWVHIPAERLLAVYSTFLNGTEVINYARIYDPTDERVGFDEVHHEYVREYERKTSYDEVGNIIGFGAATWKLWEEVESEDETTKVKKTEWVVKDFGAVTIGIIPLVPFKTGKRNGMSWTIKPPLRDLVNMQIEEFQQESSLKHIKELTAFPMLSASGVTQPKNEAGEALTVPVGPKSVLFAPLDQAGRHGEWKFIEPQGSSLTFLQVDLEKLRTEMRDLGMQPLTAANLTVITTANVSMKAHSAVQAWAIGFKDALEQAWIITCKWLNRKDYPTVKVHTDFGVDMQAQTELDYLAKCEAQGILSKQTVRDESKRRGILSDDFDEDEEQKRLAGQQAGLTPETIIDPTTGALIQLDPVTGLPLNKPPPTIQ